MFEGQLYKLFGFCFTYYDICHIKYATHGKKSERRVHLISQHNSISSLENVEAQGEKHLLFT